MNSHPVETIVTLVLILVPLWILWLTRAKRWTPHSEGPIDARSTRVLRQDERLDAYALRFSREDESRLRRVAVGIEAHKRVVERTKQIPKHRALVVIHKPAKSNVVQLPSGVPVQVEWRRPKLSIAR